MLKTVMECTALLNVVIRVNIYYLTAWHLSVCRNHDWFKVDLQSYLFPSPNHHDDNIVDVDIVIELCDVSSWECGVVTRHFQFSNVSLQQK